MNNCDICGKPCGEYTLCPDCFKLMQEGKVLKCKNCDHWYKDGDMCKCVLATDATPTANNDTQPQQPTSIQQEEAPPKKKELGCLGEGILMIVKLIIIAIVSLLFVFFVTGYAAMYEEIKDNPNRYGETSVITAMFKSPPTLSYKDVDDLTEATSIILLLKANDNYKEVVIELRIYDENNVIIKTTHLTQTDLTEGETYSLTYNLSLTELANASYSEASVYKYK